MEQLYQDIARRTQGDIYLGVVGPVRTGKSTFIKRFMDLLVLPHIDNAYQRERTRDELPQSAAGRTIMTTEPKFVPAEAVEICLDQNATFRVRMIDCVGYIVDSALGHVENDQPRMVSTPWFEEEVPFRQAAEIGTQKVIQEHSTIGLVVTTDGSISEFAREDYLPSERRVVQELQEIEKPFVILLNSINPESTKAQELCGQLREEYAAPVIAVNCAEMDMEDINRIMQTALFEFPVVEISFFLPRWMECLSKEHWLKQSLTDALLDAVAPAEKVRDVYDAVDALQQCEYIQTVGVREAQLGNGKIGVEVTPRESLFYQVLSEQAGVSIADEHGLMALMQELVTTKRSYDKIANALAEVEQTGYGIVTPAMEELTLEEPEIVKQGSRYGVRLRASAPSIHMIRADIETEVSPVVGTEKQSEELVHYLLQEFEVDPQKIWESNIFGKSLHELVNEGLRNKLNGMPDDARMKLKDTLQKIINEGSGGLICIIL